MRKREGEKEIERDRERSGKEQQQRVAGYR